MLSYTPPPHMDAKALIERAMQQLQAWQSKYAEWQPTWPPPAGDVRWMEDAAAYLAAHTLPAPQFKASGLVHVCERNDAACVEVPAPRRCPGCPVGGPQG